jgi:HK97 family phage portal protein
MRFSLKALMQRMTSPRQDSGGLPMLLRASGKAVTEDTAYTVSAYWCCVRVISETIGQMPWRIHERTATGQRVAEYHPADRLLNRNPNAEQDAGVWRELMLRNCLTWGNAYCEIVRDASYRPTDLWPIEPWRVTPVRYNGDLYYNVSQPTGQTVPIPAADMLHFRGLGDDLVGWSVLQYAARSLGLSMAQEESMAAMMENGARISGILKPPGAGSFTAEKTKGIADAWKEQNVGSKNHGKVYLINQGIEFQSLSMPNTDAQLLESRQFSVIDICRFMRVPPHKVFDLTRATFSNITHQSLEFLIDTLGPWVVKFEQQANRKLVSASASGRYFTKINTNAILRMDPDTRSNWYKSLRELGAISPNEIRALEDMDSLGPDGDLYLVPLNMQTLEKANAEPEPPPPPTPPTPPVDLIPPPTDPTDDPTDEAT